MSGAMLALIASNMLLWAAVIGLGLLCLALARQVGVLHARSAPAGALLLPAGPKIGEAAPIFELMTLAGARLRLGGTDARAALVFCLSPTCPVCKSLLPAIKTLAASEAATLRVILASDGDETAQRAFIARQGLQLPYVLSESLGLAYQIGKLPYAVLIAPDGRLAAKGLVNSREQLESLLTAAELGVASAQEYRRRQSHQDHAA